MLWYRNPAAEAGVTVVAYEDSAHGVMVQDNTSAGQFESVALHPCVTITADSDPNVAEQLHSKVPGVCFMTRSVAFPCITNHPSSVFRARPQWVNNSSGGAETVVCGA